MATDANQDDHGGFAAKHPKAAYWLGRAPLARALISEWVSSGRGPVELPPWGWAWGHLGGQVLNNMTEQSWANEIDLTATH